MTTSSAPGKLILCGEHAVVYGQPAIAVPVYGVQATAQIEAWSGSDVYFTAPDINTSWRLTEQPAHPLSQLVLLAGQQRHVVPLHLNITLSSTIPVASGMGSGAALGAALVQALGLHWQDPFTPSEVAALVFESERFYHGTPSGIDNTVVTWGQPIVFQRNETGPHIEPLVLAQPLQLVIGDTGQRCATKITVGRVREQWQATPHALSQRFAAIGTIVYQLRLALATGDLLVAGALLNRNQDELQALDISSPALEHLIAAARQAGAAGAKLSGGGGGGVMLALVQAATLDQVCRALLRAGATQVLTTMVQPTEQIRPNKAESAVPPLS